MHAILHDLRHSQQLTENAIENRESIENAEPSAHDKLLIALWTKLSKLLSVCLLLCGGHYSTVSLHVTGYA